MNQQPTMWFDEHHEEYDNLVVQQKDVVTALKIGRLRTAREGMAAEHQEFPDYPGEEQMRTLNKFYPDIDWLQVRYNRD